MKERRNRTGVQLGKWSKGRSSSFIKRIQSYTLIESSGGQIVKLDGHEGIRSILMAVDCNAGGDDEVEEGAEQLDKNKRGVGD